MFPSKFCPDTTASIFVFSLLFLTGLVVLPLASEAQFSGGNGTAEQPYLISSPEQVNEIRLYPQAHFQLTDNLDFRGVTFSENGSHWIPIGDDERPFRGSLHGNGYSIANVNIGSFANMAGLFGVISGGKISDLSLVNVNVLADSVTYAGALASKMISGSSVSNVIIEVELSGVAKFAGGLAGVVSDGVQVASVEVFGNITNSGPAGGLVAVSDNRAGNRTSVFSESHFEGTVTNTLKEYNPALGTSGFVGTLVNAVIYNSSAEAVVRGRDWVGGISGYVEHSEIRSAVFQGEVWGDFIVAGLVGELIRSSVFDAQVHAIVQSENPSARIIAGFVGCNGMCSMSFYDSDADSRIFSSRFSGEVLADAEKSYVTGGFVGLNKGIIANSSAEVTVRGGYRVGGFVASAFFTSEIVQSKVIARVFGSNQVGGFVGYAASPGFPRKFATISEIYVEAEVEGQRNSGGVAGIIEQAEIRDVLGNVLVHKNGSSGLFASEIRQAVVFNTMLTTDTHADYATSFTHRRIGAPNQIGHNFIYLNVDTTASQWPELPTGSQHIGYLNPIEVRNQGYYKQAGWDMETVWGHNRKEQLGIPFLRAHAEIEHQPLPFMGIGSQTDPFLIENQEQLDKMRYFLSSHFKLTSDIHLKYTSDPEDESGKIRYWQPIGDENRPFSGSFDGNGHTIRNLIVLQPEKDFAGLFGIVRPMYDIPVPSQPAIRNVILTNAELVGGDFTGLLAGKAEASLLQQNVVQGNIFGGSNTGGLVGYLGEGSLISGNYIMGSFEGEQNTGGLIGSMMGNSQLLGNRIHAVIFGHENTAGLFGFRAHREFQISNPMDIRSNLVKVQLSRHNPPISADHLRLSLLNHISETDTYTQHSTNSFLAESVIGVADHFISTGFYEQERVARDNILASSQTQEVQGASCYTFEDHIAVWRSQEASAWLYHHQSLSENGNDATYSLILNNKGYDVRISLVDKFNRKLFHHDSPGDHSGCDVFVWRNDLRIAGPVYIRIEAADGSRFVTPAIISSR